MAKEKASKEKKRLKEKLNLSSSNKKIPDPVDSIADPQTPPRKSKAPDSPQSVEKHNEKKPEGNKGKSKAQAEDCRPANFGRKEKRTTALLAKPGRPVPTSPDRDEQGAIAEFQEELDGDDELNLSCPKIARRPHKRVKKVEVSSSVVKLFAVKKYLGSIGIVWPEFQRIHSKLLVLHSE